MSNSKALSSYLLLTALTAFVLPTYAQLGKEETNEIGTLNPSNFSWRNYKEKMERFPERIGIICFNAYMLDKTGAHLETLKFLKSCAEHGNVASMIYIASLYENGGIPVDYKESAYWLKRGADTDDKDGYSALAAYHYGVALSKGCGVKKDLKTAQFYLQKAAANGISEAAGYLSKSVLHAPN